MPTRKSDAHKGDVSALAAGADDTSQTNVVDDSILSTATTQADREKSITEGSTGNKKGKEAAAVENDKITIEDLTLPKSIITRLAKGVLPPNTQIQANAIMAMSKSTTVFISYLAAHANEITLNANKKTIMPTDVFKALEEIEFDFLKEPLEAEFAKFNAIQTDKRNTYRQKVKAATKPTGANEDEDDTDMAGGDTSTAAAAAATAATTASKAAASNGDGDEAPRSKKARVDASPAPEETTDADEDAVEETDEDEKEEEEEDEEEEEEEEEDEEDEEDEGGEGRDSSEETQDALEERLQGEEPDEALDGDESD
ncbi:hypothetical protein ARSEF1564_007719 [Beauveria bassiana]